MVAIRLGKVLHDISIGLGRGRERASIWNDTQVITQLAQEIKVGLAGEAGKYWQRGGGKFREQDGAMFFQKRPYILEPKDMSIPCAIAREVADARYANYRQVIFEVAKAYPNVTIFDPAAFLCDENYCWAGKGGKMLYVDEHHLSGFGVALLAPELEKILNRLQGD